MVAAQVQLSFHWVCSAELQGASSELAGAARIAEAARSAVARLNIAHAHSPAASYVSISGGVAVLPGKGGLTAQQLIAAADQSLFEAKHSGRNRMVSVPAEAA